LEIEPYKYDLDLSSAMKVFKKKLKDSEERLLSHYSGKVNCGFAGGMPNNHECGLKASNVHTLGSGVGQIVREIVLVRLPVPIRQRNLHRG
jgi:hypothetical protein